MHTLWSRCSCMERLQRVRRRLWMRLFPSRRLYRCEACRSLQFVKAEEVARDHVPGAAG